jgi:hypothetical protein
MANPEAIHLNTEVVEFGNNGVMEYWSDAFKTNTPLLQYSSYVLLVALAFVWRFSSSHEKSG